MTYALLLLALSAGAPADTLQRTMIADGVYLFRAPSSLDRWTSSNAVVIVNQSDVTVFDNSARTTTSRLLIAEIRKVTDKPVRTLINSHWHMDHWMGNEEFAKAFPGLQIIATAETREYMKRKPAAYFLNSARGDSALARDVGAATPVLPNHVFSDSLTIWNGEREYRLVSMTGDASGSAVLYLPRERILITGDVLPRAEDGRGAQPWTTNSYKIRPWLESLRQMDALDVRVIVPGQGPAMFDKAHLRRTIGLFESIISQVAAAAEKGIFRMDQLVAAVDLRAIRSGFTGDDPALNTRFDAVASGLIRKAFQELHDGIAPVAPPP
jgi:glyoxylase-like metal-dependent hydrolase (beta-lactamase superfamily II)